MTHYSRHDGARIGLAQRMLQVNWTLVVLICLTASIGFIMLYSAAGGNFEPWATRQMVRFGIGILGMLFVAMIDIRIWMKLAYVAFGVSLVLLAAVEFAGTGAGGAQRWISLGLFNLQPSELVKIAMVLALARYFHGRSHEQIGNPLYLVVPLLIVFVPAALVMKQPDLGTAVLMVAVGGAIFFLAGVRIWKFILVVLGALAAIPIGWQYLHAYQRQRILTFLDPEQDPLGSGYHILQSQIALGSGGLFGKGYMQGTQANLNFLPEKQTDFIFTMLSEEFGFVGALTLIGLYLLLLIYGYAIALRSRSQYGRLVALGITSTFFLYIFINVAMVMGLIPVVGVPLPLVSYGGTALLALLFGFGLLLNVYVYRDIRLARTTED
ncbi:MAG: rod shape-determining protein RodA [Alphaproteobacteria bacterium]|nr:rod shape-determining protein RodA [Alphaproteobacteria bacterium]